MKRIEEKWLKQFVIANNAELTLIHQRQKPDIPIGNCIVDGYIVYVGIYIVDCTINELIDILKIKRREKEIEIKIGGYLICVIDIDSDLRLLTQQWKNDVDWNSIGDKTIKVFNRTKKINKILAKR